MTSADRRAPFDLVEVEAGHVFWVRSVHDILRKLHREKRRFERAEESREGMSDHVDAAINFAITAWHMTDWVWVQHEDKLRERFYVSSRREFQDEMRRLCPGLAICDVIANAAKHGGVAHDRKDRPGIETVLIAHPVGDGAGGAEVVAVLDERRWSLTVEVDGVPQDPRTIFNQIFSFGTDLCSNTASLIRCPNMLNIEDSGVPNSHCVSHNRTDIDEQLHRGAGGRTDCSLVALRRVSSPGSCG